MVCRKLPVILPSFSVYMLVEHTAVRIAHHTACEVPDLVFAKSVKQLIVSELAMSNVSAASAQAYDDSSRLLASGRRSGIFR